MNTLLLDRRHWDLVLDVAGNIAMAKEPYAIAQDVASACRLFAGELWYATNKGIPYFSEILGHWPPLAVVRARLIEAALTVPGVVSAQVVITEFKDRTITGQVQFIDTTGASHGVTF
jgi:ligand-binding sensor domain-containing protein